MTTPISISIGALAGKGSSFSSRECRFVSARQARLGRLCVERTRLLTPDEHATLTVLSDLYSVLHGTIDETERAKLFGHREALLDQIEPRAWEPAQDVAIESAALRSREASPTLRWKWRRMHAFRWARRRAGNAASC